MSAGAPSPIHKTNLTIGIFLLILVLVFSVHVSLYYQAKEDLDDLEDFIGWNTTLSCVNKTAISSMLYQMLLTNHTTASNLKDNSVVDVKPSAENRSVANELLIYTRVPKTASTTTNLIIEEMSQQLHYRHTSVPIGNPFHVNRRGEKLFLYHHYRTPWPYVSDEHIGFINVKDFNITLEERPNWFSTVRDPIQRLVSRYHFVRKRIKSNISNNTFHAETMKDWLKRSFDDCAANSGCLRGDIFHHFQFSFFCGNKAHCWIGARASSMLKAKHNVEKYYSVVGVTEDLKATMTVAEAYLPRFFRGASKLYSKKFSDVRLNTQTYAGISNGTYEILRKNKFVNWEYDFFHFCQQRLQRQLQKINQ